MPGILHSIPRFKGDHNLKVIERNINIDSMCPEITLSNLFVGVTRLDRGPAICPWESSSNPHGNLNSKIRNKRLKNYFISTNQSNIYNSIMSAINTKNILGTISDAVSLKYSVITRFIYTQSFKKHANKFKVKNYDLTIYDQATSNKHPFSEYFKQKSEKK